MDSGSYETLSYVWGDQADRTPVQINNRTLMIGTNLRSALFNLRYEDRHRILWVDAICIDQGSIGERSQQVSIMGEIYRRARRVLIWLRDEDEEDSPKVFPMLEDLASGALDRAAKSSIVLERKGPPCLEGGHEETEKILALHTIPNYMIERADIDDPLADKHRNDFSIMYLIASEWWYRAWTLQEILLAKDAVIVVGQYNMSWWRFCLGVNHGLSIGIWAPITMGVMIDGMLLPYVSVQRLEERQIRRRAEGMKVAQELLEFLNSSRFRDATNPRDKIYSLLGLVGQEGVLAAQLNLITDYSLSVADVYKQATERLIRTSSTLDVLGSAGLIPDHVHDPELPFWVPDWRYTKMVCMPLMHDALGRYRATHATKGTAADATAVNFAGEGRTLIVLGHEVTTITAVAPIIHRIVHRSDEYDNQIAKWEKQIQDNDSVVRSVFVGASILVQIAYTIYDALMSVVPHLGIYMDWENFATATKPTNPQPIHTNPQTEPYDPLSTYWQTLCVGTYVSSPLTAPSNPSISDPAPAALDKSATKDLFYLWRATLKPIRDLHKWRVDRLFRPLAFVGYVRKTWQNYGEFVRLLEGAYERRMARGENGYLCLVPGSAEVGDKVVLARGGKVPLVVRREGEGNDWKFIGEAYVHGIMDGEAWFEERAGPMSIR